MSFLRRGRIAGRSVPRRPMGLVSLALAGAASASPVNAQVIDPGSAAWATQAAYEFAVQADHVGLQGSLLNGTMVIAYGETGGDRGLGYTANGQTTVIVPYGTGAEMCGAVAVHEWTHATSPHHAPPPPAGSDFPNTTAERAFWASECEAHEAVAASLLDRANGSPPVPPLCTTVGSVIADGAAACSLANDLANPLPANPFENPVLGALFKAACR